MTMDTFRCGHARSPENTNADRRCRTCTNARVRARADKRREAEGRQKRVVDPDWFPCGHPRTAENTRTGANLCRECHRLREAARHAAKLAAAGKEKRVMDPDTFRCGHPRAAGNLTATRQNCRACHIDRAVKAYQQGARPKGNQEALRERGRAYRQCHREERRDPVTTEYLRIIRSDPCSYCGGHGGTRDHVIPMAAGGPNHWENYTGACLSCNVGKNDKPLLTFLLDRLLLQRARDARSA